MILSPYEYIKKKIVLLATLLLIVGLFFIVYSNTTDCYHIIKNKAENSILLKPYKGKPTVIYLISAANKKCNPLYKYETLKALKKDVCVVFLVAEDYTDIDIENFRFAFKIPEKHIVKKIHGEWKNILTKCIRSDNMIFNIVMTVKEDGTIAKIRRF
jgi:hypothetical protein